MSTLVVLLCGTAFGVGGLLVLLGLFAGDPTGTRGPERPPQADGQRNRPRNQWAKRVGFGPQPGLPDLMPPGVGSDPDGRPAWWRSFDRGRVRVGLALAAGLIALAVTGWPVGALLAVVGSLLAPSLAGAKSRREAVVARTEAVAAWAEQLRDTIGAAAGLQEAIATTARVAPTPIRPAVADMAAGMRRNALGPELHRFADRLADPLADQIAVALILASERRGDDLTRLLDDLAETARADATMRIRTETARASTYNDAKVVTIVVLLMFGFMLLVNRGYLAAFDTWAGQAVLAVVGSLWIAAIYGIVSLSQVRRLPRLLAVQQAAGPGPGGGAS